MRGIVEYYRRQLYADKQRQQWAAAQSSPSNKAPRSNYSDDLFESDYLQSMLGKSKRQKQKQKQQQHKVVQQKSKL